jgi:hypothetical protein
MIRLETMMKASEQIRDLIIEPSDARVRERLGEIQARVAGLEQSLTDARREVDLRLTSERKIHKSWMEAATKALHGDMRSLRTKVANRLEPKKVRGCNLNR